MESEPETVSLLREIRDQQRLQIERQAESMALQREQVALVRQQFERAERIQTRAEALQGNATKAVRVVIWVILPMALFLGAMLVLNNFPGLFHR